MPKQPFFSPLLVFLVPFLAGGCGVPVIPGEIVYQDPTTFVRIEPDPNVTPDKAASLHDHPVSISPQEFAAILSGLRVRDHRIGIHAMIAGKAPWEPVFGRGETALLAPHLADALARARRDERITYYLGHPRTSITRQVTSGGLYVQGNRLHFVLSNHNVQYGVPAYGMVYDRRYPMRPTAPKWFDLHFDPEDAVVEQRYSLLDFLFGRETDELVIDLGKLGLGLPVVWSGPGGGRCVTGMPRVPVPSRYGQ